MPCTCTWAHPYIINQHIEWESVKLDHSFNSFEDEEAENEYVRFVHRDIMNIIVGYIFAFGGVGTTQMTLSANVAHAPPIVYTVSVLLIIINSIDLYIFLFYTGDVEKWTVQMAKIREFLRHASYILASAIGCFMGGYGNGIFCPDTVYPTHADRRMCVLRVRPLPAITMTAAALAHKGFKPMWAIIYLCFGVFTTMISRLSAVPALTVEHAGDTAGEVFIVSFTFFLIACTGIILSILQHQIQVNQFLQAVSVEIGLRKAAKRHEEVDTLLNSMLPHSALTRLLADEPVHDVSHDTSVFFSDVVQFTKWSSSRTAQQVAAMLNTLVMRFDKIAEVMGINKIKTIGDAYWCCCGIPDSDELHCDKLCSFAVAVLAALKDENKKNPKWEGVRLRIGIHCGPIQGAIISAKAISYEVFGETNEIAEEFEKEGVPMEVAISEFVAVQLTDFEKIDLDAPAKLIKVPGTDEEMRLYILPKRKSKSDDPFEMSQSESARSQKSRMSMRSRMSYRVGAENQAEAQTHSKQEKKEELERQKREAFIQERAAKRGALLPSAEDFERIQEQFSKRKYSCWIQTFEDEEAEYSFFAFVLGKYLMARKISSIAISVLMVWIIIVPPMQPVQGSFPTWCLILIVVAVVLTLPAAVLTFLFPDPSKKAYAIAAAWMHYLALGLLMLGSLGTYNIATTHWASWQRSVIGCLIAMGNPALSAPIHMIVNLFLGILELAYLFIFCTAACDTSLNVVFLFLTLVFLGFWLHIHEILLRREYLEVQVTAFYTKVRLAQAEAQRGLLEAVVPSFVIDPLMVWMDTGYDPEKTLTFTYPKVCIMFLFIFPPAEHEQHHASPKPENTALAPLTSKEVEGIPVIESTGDVVVPNESEMESHNWHRKMHRHVDDMLGDHDGAIVKIKTVGDIVIAAGPFESDRATPEDTAAAFVALIDVLRHGYQDYLCPRNKPIAPSPNADGHNPNPDHNNDLSVSQKYEIAEEQHRTAGEPEKKNPPTLPSFKCGFNVGEVVAAVMGTLRLTFDIFGDTMNTCSRTMSTGPTDVVSCTEGFAEVLTTSIKSLDDSSEALPGSSQEVVIPKTNNSLKLDQKKLREGLRARCRLGEREERPAKGKGFIPCHQVMTPEDAGFSNGTVL